MIVTVSCDEVSDEPLAFKLSSRYIHIDLSVNVSGVDCVEFLQLAIRKQAMKIKANRVFIMRSIHRTVIMGESCNNGVTMTVLPAGNNCLCGADAFKVKA